VTHVFTSRMEPCQTGGALPYAIRDWDEAVHAIRASCSSTSNGSIRAERGA